MKNDRSKPKTTRAKPGGAPARAGARKPPRTYGDAPPRRAPARPTRDRAEGGDPYKPARRPARDSNRGEDTGERFARTERTPFKERAPYGERASYGERKPYGERKAYGERKPYGERKTYGERKPYAERKPFVPREERGGGYGERGGRGFTVTLDPDVARVFRGDASVNKALRLVLQLMQVVQGPPPRPDRPRGYQGSAEARGFERKPRFGDDDEIEAGAEEEALDTGADDESDEGEPEGTE